MDKTFDLHFLIFWNLANFGHTFDKVSYFLLKLLVIQVLFNKFFDFCFFWNILSRIFGDLSYVKNVRQQSRIHQIWENIMEKSTSILAKRTSSLGERTSILTRMSSGLTSILSILRISWHVKYAWKYFRISKAFLEILEKFSRVLLASLSIFLVLSLI